VPTFELATDMKLRPLRTEMSNSPWWAAAWLCAGPAGAPAPRGGGASGGRGGAASAAQPRAES
jgi:hypothetical protein